MDVNPSCLFRLWAAGANASQKQMASVADWYFFVTNASSNVLFDCFSSDAASSNINLEINSELICLADTNLLSENSTSPNSNFYKQFVAFAACDLIEQTALTSPKRYFLLMPKIFNFLMCHSFFRSVDKFNEYIVSCLISPTSKHYFCAH